MSERQRENKQTNKQTNKHTNSLTQRQHLTNSDPAPRNAADRRPLAPVLHRARHRASDVLHRRPDDDVVERPFEQHGALLLEVELEGQRGDVRRRLVRVAQVVHEPADLEQRVLDHLAVSVEVRQVARYLDFAGVPGDHVERGLELDAAGFCVLVWWCLWSEMGCSPISLLFNWKGYLRRPLGRCEALNASFNRGIDKPLLGCVAGIEVDGEETQDRFYALEQADEFGFVLVGGLYPFDAGERRIFGRILKLSL